MARRRIMDDSDSDEEDHDVAVADMDVDAENDGQPPSSSSSPAPRRSLQRRLEREAGVRPSHGWLDQCLTYLRSSAGGNAHSDDDDAEGVWNQILYSDLRDVVREEGSEIDADGETAAMQLRAAVAQSKRRPTDDPANGGNGNSNDGNGKSTYVSHKATLPSAFRLLIQMEEVVDVTMNGEQRLAAMGGGGGDGAAAANNRGAHRNPEHRCLKMAFSDGYHADGRAYSSSSDAREVGKENSSPPLLAMETSPIRDLSASSPPGTKVLLRGPIDVRLGLLQLHDGNVAVVGGEVEGWNEVWRKARERAQREKGLGVDPTIKALIWNPLMGDEEEADEGEGESGDVAAAVAAVPPLVAQPPQIQAPPPQQPLPQPIITQTQPTPRPNSNNPISSRVPYQSQTSHTTNSSSRGSTGNNLRQRTLDSYPKKPRPETTRLHPSNTSTGKRSRQAVLHNASNNPYQRSSVNAQSTSRAPPQQQQPPPVRNQQQQQQPLPVRHQQQQQQQQQSSPLRNQQQQRQSPSPHTRNDTNIIPIDDSPPSSIFHKSTRQPPQQRPNPYASLRPSPSAAPPAAAAANAVADSLARTPAFTSNPSFSELKSILLSLRTDRALYERYFGNIITVPCKMDPGPSKVFNIVKAGSGEKKKNKMKKEKKYEFLLVGQFFGPKQSDGGIACRVESSTVGNYFTSYTPASAEIRKLSREDKVRANRIVNQGSSQFIHDYSSLGQIQMKLLMAPDEFFEKMSSASDNWLSDTANPILLVVKKV